MKFCNCVHAILRQCDVLKKLSHLTVRITRICKICETVTSSDDERNILHEQLSGNSMTEIISGKVLEEFITYFHEMFYFYILLLKLIQNVDKSVKRVLLVIESAQKACISIIDVEVLFQRGGQKDPLEC